MVNHIGIVLTHVKDVWVNVVSEMTVMVVDVVAGFWSGYMSQSVVVLVDWCVCVWINNVS